MIEYKCKECSKNICKRTALYGNGRCKSCANKGKRNPNYNKRKIGSENHRWKGGKPKCKICNKQLTNYKSNYCYICFPKSRKNKPRSGKNRYGKFAPCYKDGRSILPNYCINCNKQINWKSKRCKKCWHDFNIGKNHVTYVHGKGNAPYPLKFSKKLRNKIKIRDNFRCQRCHMTEQNHIKKFNQQLHVHHIDYDKQNCNDDNLITTCQLCNIKANFNRDYWYAYFKYIMDSKD